MTNTHRVGRGHGNSGLLPSPPTLSHKMENGQKLFSRTTGVNVGVKTRKQVSVTNFSTIKWMYPNYSPERTYKTRVQKIFV